MKPLIGPSACKQRVCVGALLLCHRDTLTRVLLGKRAADRAFYPDVWDVLGGHCEPGEPPERTLVREVEEEVGVTPTAWQLLDEFREPLHDRDEMLVLHLYVVTAWAGTPHNRLPEEHAAISWFAVEDACRLALAHPQYPTLFRRLISTPESDHL